MLSRDTRPCYTWTTKLSSEGRCGIIVSSLPYTWWDSVVQQSQNRHDRRKGSPFRLSKGIRKEMQEERKTKEVRGERVEKRAREIALRGSHLKLVCYNGK